MDEAESLSTEREGQSKPQRCTQTQLQAQGRSKMGPRKPWQDPEATGHQLISLFVVVCLATAPQARI
jgi:hypothetical protein